MDALFYLEGDRWSGSARAFGIGARGLAARGADVAVVCRAGTAVERKGAALGIEVLPIAEGGMVIAEAWRLRRLIRRRFTDVVFVTTSREHLIASLAVALARRGAVLRRVPAGATLPRDRATAVATRIAPTGTLFASTADLERNDPPLRQRIAPAIVALGVDPARHAPTAGAPVPTPGGSTPVLGLRERSSSRTIVGLCAPAGRGSAALLLRTVALLRPHHPELHVVLAGEGAAHNDLRMHAAALGLARVVTYADGDLTASLQQADAGWVVGEHDDAAFAALDLMAMRLPVIAARAAVLEEYVADGITGLLVPATDAPQSAARVAPLLARDAERAAMGSAALARVNREFPETSMIDGFQRAAEAAIERAR